MTFLVKNQKKKSMFFSVLSYGITHISYFSPFKPIISYHTLLTFDIYWTLTIVRLLHIFTFLTLLTFLAFLIFFTFINFHNWVFTFWYFYYLFYLCYLDYRSFLSHHSYHFWTFLHRENRGVYWSYIYMYSCSKSYKGDDTNKAKQALRFY